MRPSAPFTVSDAVAAGMTRKQLRAARFVAPTRGIRVLRELADDRCVLDALALAARDDHFFSRSTAARIHGMPLPLGFDATDIHVSAPTAGSRMRRRGVRGHRVRAATVMVDGLRVEAPADVFVHLAASLEHGALVAIADWLVSPRRGRGTMSPSELWAHCDARPGAPGISRARRAVLDCRVGAESVRETDFRLHLASLGLDTPELNVSVYDDSRAFVCRLDGGFPDVRAAWEYDGEQHFTDPVQQRIDLDRVERAARVGWRVRRFAKHHLTPSGSGEVAMFVAEMRARLDASAARTTALRGFWAPCTAPRALRR